MNIDPHILAIPVGFEPCKVDPIDLCSLCPGDASSTVSALCYTVAKSAQGSSLHALESGSDYKSRGVTNDNRVIFGPGVSMSTCDVMLIDDSEYELSEEFELVLSDASDNARVGVVSVAKVIIDGPNDASTVSLGNATFTFSEDAGMSLFDTLLHSYFLFVFELFRNIHRKN